jgi:feruloyl-CoA synthase
MCSENASTLRTLPKETEGMADLFADPSMLATPHVVREDRGDGTFVLRSPEPLQSHARCIGEWLEQWARETPDAPALAERDASGAWRCLSWRDVRSQVGAIAQALLDMQMPADAPVVVLSDNSVDHALLMLATMHVGRAACTVSSAYSRLGPDFTKIRGILKKLRPGLVYACDAATYGAALRAVDVSAPVVLGRGHEELPGAINFERLRSTAETAAVMQAFEAIQPDDHAKYLLTSGSTGHPKVVINTHRMLCANQQMIGQAWCFLEREKPVLLDWLPWSHTFGGNHNFNMVLCHGGTLYIDDGRPVPALIERTVRNLREVRSTIHFNVPRGIDMLLPYLEKDEMLARQFFTGLRALFYAGAALAPSSWQRLEAVAAKVRDEPLWLTTSWGSTETSPAVTSAHWQLDGAGCIGAPLPGAELKFVPNGQKLELRVRGAGVFPGYRDDPELTAAAFDEEGYYLIGDAGKLVDEAHPEKGVLFDGRVAEDFKLGSGTWVSVGTLRVKLVSALAPLVADAVITGHDRDAVGALLFPTAAAQALPYEDLKAQLREKLKALHSTAGGSAQSPARVLLMSDAPSLAAGEITDKGYVNQRAVLANRAADVVALYGSDDDPRLLCVDRI